MPFTADQIADINNQVLMTYIDKGKVYKQDIDNKPLLKELESRAGTFTGGNEYVSLSVGSGYGGGALQGYSGDDQLTHYNPTGLKRIKFPWKEHYIGMQVTMSELKTDGIDVVESGADQTTNRMEGREAQALANLLDEKMDKLNADYTLSLETLLHGDGSSDTKALAGIQSLVYASPAVGSTGGLSRPANDWWRNRAATAAFGSAGGQGAITSASTAGGALITFLDKEVRQLQRRRDGQTVWKCFAGSAFIDAYKAEMRANGYYSQTGWTGKTIDGSMADPTHGPLGSLIYDPWLDDNSLSKRCYVLDVGKSGIRLMYMQGNKLKKHNPARPYDRMVMYNGMSMTGVMIAKRLNTSGVYDIA